MGLCDPRRDVRDERGAAVKRHCVVCAWCVVVLVIGYRTREVSHGICAFCLAKNLDTSRGLPDANS